MNKESREEIENLLKQYTVQVGFTKVSDNVHRVMQATLIPEQIPETKGGPSQSNEERLCVFNVDLQQWRSFIYDRLSYVTWFEPMGPPFRAFKQHTKNYLNGAEIIENVEDI